MDKRAFLKSGLAVLGCAACGLNHRQVSALSLDRELPAAANGLWKWSREAYHYRITDRGVQCTNCPNECTLKRKETSKCRNRINIGDKLYSIAYGNPCAVHIDPIEKKPFFHFFPTSQAFSIATAGCNFSCLNCQNWEISQKSPKETSNYDLMPAKVVDECLKKKCRIIAYTYAEPTVFYEYVYDTAVIARRQGLKNVYKSNGYINEKPLRMLCKYLDAANIDLKGFSENTYQKLNSGKLAPVLRTLKILQEEGVWLEITNLIVPTWTDNPDIIRSMCNWLVKNGLDDCPLHFSRFTPLYKLTQLPPTPVSILQKAREIALSEGMNYVYVGNLPGTDMENTRCPKCKKLLVIRKGFMVVTNYIVNGACKFCGQKIPGRWS
ncbi:MAG TPA: AmmeMemoRadiSam system radical SAM enzyme [Bacteroidales bacterium]|nr:AmmeMemoRadiSam system radical SAM enzyme [Bacteroidales bacterium]HPT01636.1 AmmeMemoRadiSam system radical SAM enzyme [Bacteroidales bacterium]